MHDARQNTRRSFFHPKKKEEKIRNPMRKDDGSV